MAEEVKPEAKDGAPAAPVAEIKPITSEDISRLQSVYDKRLSELTAELNATKSAVEVAKRDADAAKAALSPDATKALERQKQLEQQDASLKAREEAVKANGLKAAARLHAAEAKANYGVDIKVTELEKLGSEIEIELAVLRQIAGAKKPALPASGQIDRDGKSGGAPATTGNPISDTLAQMELYKKR